MARIISSRYFLQTVVLILSLLLAATPLVADPAPSLSLELELEKDTFLLHEPAWVDICLVNKGAEMTTVRPLELPWSILQVYLVNSKGDTLQYHGWRFDASADPKRELGPGQSFHHCINLLDSFGEHTYGLEKGLGRFFLREDSYTLQMYHDGVLSNKTRFIVEAPRNEESKAHDLLKQAYYHDIRLDNVKVIEVLQQLVAAYPKSVYVDLAYYELAGHYRLVGEPDKTHDYLRQLVLKYPDSHFVLKALPDLLRQMSTDRRREFLTQITEKHPETRASGLARGYLKNFQEERKAKE